jgi:hypothetical protein
MVRSIGGACAANVLASTRMRILDRLSDARVPQPRRPEIEQGLLRRLVRLSEALRTGPPGFAERDVMEHPAVDARITPA